ncbi:hypothetical protein [Latilactobacillus sakei]|uniref:hypothetical protein n=1 Tax=Latilactobacillus sakei TaxID=1599 RepID=UPI001F09BE45|nr:hypothetical protein [Latilactobacillus sakei]
MKIKESLAVGSFAFFGGILRYFNRIGIESANWVSVWDFVRQFNWGVLPTIFDALYRGTLTFE